MEVVMSGDDPIKFVQAWIAAANNASGQATKVKAEFPANNLLKIFL